jgi:hypothetical protein
MYLFKNNEEDVSKVSYLLLRQYSFNFPEIMIEFLPLIISTLEPIDNYTEYEFKNSGLYNSYLKFLGILEALKPKIFEYKDIYKIFDIYLLLLKKILKYSNYHYQLITKIMDFFYSCLKVKINFRKYFKNQKITLL